MFASKHRFCLTLLRQEIHTLCKNCNSASFRSLGRCRDEIAQEVQKSYWIREVVHHEARQGLGSIQQDVPPLLNSDSNIHAMCLQSRRKAVPVCLGRDNYSRIPGPESIAHELRELV